jgi:cytochrome c-type biogenesis protein CcmH
MPMHTIFFLVAMLMTVVALALVLVPLLRERLMVERRFGEMRRELRALNDANSAAALEPAQYTAQLAALGDSMLVYLDNRSKHAMAAIYAALSLGIVVPLAAFGVYHWVAKPQGIPGSAMAAVGHSGSAADPNGAGAPMPDDHGGDMQAAIARLAEKLHQHPDDPQGWALLGRTYKATQHYAEAREAFKHALDAAPDDAGLEREYAAAGTPNDDAATEPQQCPVSAAAGECNEPSAAPSDSTRVVVKVALDPKFKDSVGPDDTLFVFAKAARGSPMPLAIARLKVAQLPASVTLTDAMGMVPSLTLSQFPQIVVGARISKSGNAIAQSGDLQTLSASMTTAQAEPVKLTIAERVE